MGGVTAPREQLWGPPTPPPEGPLCQAAGLPQGQCPAAFAGFSGSLPLSAPLARRKGVEGAGDLLPEEWPTSQGDVETHPAPVSR